MIGRYFSRCQQYRDGKFWRKRLIDGDPKRQDGEAQAILENGFAIMSIYQYNNREEKFAGRVYPPCIKTKYEKEIEAASPQAREGILDAEAALAQAEAVKQPKKTVIYFGVDYDFRRRIASKQTAYSLTFGRSESNSTLRTIESARTLMAMHYRCCWTKN